MLGRYPGSAADMPLAGDGALPGRRLTCGAVSPPAVIAIAFVFAVIVGFSFVLGAPIVGVPFLLLAIGAFGAGDVLRRQRRARNIKRFRAQAAAQRTDFTAQDRRTQV